MGRAGQKGRLRSVAGAVAPLRRSVAVQTLANAAETTGADSVGVMSVTALVARLLAVVPLPSLSVEVATIRS